MKDSVGPIIPTSNGRFRIAQIDTVMGPKLTETGEWEPEQTALVKALLRPGDLFVDVGANLGWHAVVAAQAVAPTGHVVAIEPDPANFALLRENLAINFLDLAATPFQLALTDSPGPLTLELSPDNLGDHRVRYTTPAMDKDHFREHERAVTEVTGETLDQLMARLPARASRPEVRLLKMDTQGSEQRIVAGGAETLRRVRFLLAEFWPYALERAGGSAAGLLEELGGEFDRIRVVDGFANGVAELRGQAIDPAALIQMAESMEGGAYLDLLFYRAADSAELP